MFGAKDFIFHFSLRFMLTNPDQKYPLYLYAHVVNNGIEFFIRNFENDDTEDIEQLKTKQNLPVHAGEAIPSLQNISGQSLVTYIVNMKEVKTLNLNNNCISFCS